MTIEQSISYDNTKAKDDVKTLMANASRNQYLELLSPVFGEKELEGLDIDQLKDLLDEVIDRVYKVNMKDGGGVKPLSFLELQEQLNAMSDEERENLQFMLDNLKPKPKR